VGDVTGVVKMFSLSMVQNKLQCVFSMELWPYCDHIKVSKLLTVTCDKTQSSLAIIVVIKGSFIIVVALESDGTVVATYPYLVGNLSITGKSLCMLQTVSRLFIMTQMF
jgi:hypothetical protein